MDFDDPAQVAAFFTVHSGLPREGPGSRASTARALGLAGRFPGRSRVLDIACGPGAQTMDLADLLPRSAIVAVDSHRPFLEELRRRAAGLAGRVAAIEASMAALPFAAGSFDLVWCEGAAYIMGLEQALHAWRPLLADGGRLALTEPVWLQAGPPEHVRRCWAADYPGMRDVGGCRDLVDACGYQLLGDFVLPASDWWDDYYHPMERRLAEIAETLADDRAAQGVLRECREEIELYRAYADCYGYLFLVMAA